MLRTFTNIQKLLLAVSGVLLMSSIFISNWNHNTSITEKTYALDVQTKIEDFFIKSDSVISATSLERFRNPDFEFLSNQTKGLNILVFVDEQVRYWTDNHYVPQLYEINSADPIRYFSNSIGKYIVKKYVLSDSVSVFNLLELYREFPITNDYLSSEYNDKIFGKGNEVSLDYADAERQTILSIENEPLFGLSLIKVGLRHTSVGYMSIIFSFIAISLLLCVIWARLKLKVSEGKFEGSLILWIVALFLTRYVMLIGEFPDSVMETGLFGSMYFASSRLNPSLGDMLLNSIALLFIAIFLYSFYIKSGIVKRAFKMSILPKSIFAIFLSLLFFFVMWYPHVVIQTIYHNSQISLDITESNEINYIRAVCIFIFIISGLLLFLTGHIIIRVLYQLFREKYFQFLIITTLGLIAFILYQRWVSQHYLISSIMGVIFLNAMFHLRIFLQFHRLRYSALQYIFSVMAVIAIIGAYGIFEFENEREEVNMERFADHFLIRNDNLTEFYLNEANDLLKRDVFIATRFYSPFLTKDVIAQKIRQVYLYSFFDQYDVEISLLNKDREVLFGELSAEEEILANNPEAFKPYLTDYEGVYFLNRSGGDVVRRYIDIVEIKRRNEVAGYIILDLQLKKVIPNDVYFELLIDNRFIQPFLGRNYSYAVYTKNELTYNSGEFDYDNELNPAKIGDDRSFRHIRLKDNDGRSIVVSSEKYDFWRFITNFSFLFIIQVFLLLITSLGYTAVLFYNNVTLNFSTRIQLFFNLALFVPLVIVSLITISSINNSFKDEVNIEHQKKALIITQNITDLLTQFQAGEVDKDEFIRELLEVSRYTDADLNVFSIDGKLLATSKSLIYDNNLLSEYINPKAFTEIVEENETRWVTEEQVGSLVYKSAYRAIRSFQTGEIIGMLSVPFFESELHLEEQQIEVLSSIINIFTLVFITFLLISYFVSKELTFPLRLITKKLGKTTLTEENEPIKWESDDEIGLMVSEYNNMLKNLEENKRQLSKKEKESAWREIAQQVAHEIKNPLTPMKLTLQHLERSLEASGEAKKPVATLLHHIDTLNDIATSFSSFAKMPIPENEPFELIDLVYKTVRLHENQENVFISIESSFQEVFVSGDKQLMGRIISNIVLNGIQSVNPERGTVNIQLRFSIKSNKVVLEISDNGVGIEESIGNKIFVPNFTTKETGSGIGLAIAKHGIEHAGGKIWFESKLNKGSTFYIELPRIMK